MAKSNKYHSALKKLKLNRQSLLGVINDPLLGPIHENITCKSSPKDKKPLVHKTSSVSRAFRKPKKDISKRSNPLSTKSKSRKNQKLLGMVEDHFVNICQNELDSLNKIKGIHSQDIESMSELINTPVANKHKRVTSKYTNEHPSLSVEESNSKEKKKRKKKSRRSVSKKENEVVHISHKHSSRGRTATTSSDRDYKSKESKRLSSEKKEENEKARKSISKRVQNKHQGDLPGKLPSRFKKKVSADNEVNIVDLTEKKAPDSLCVNGGISQKRRAPNDIKEENPKRAKRERTIDDDTPDHNSKSTQSKSASHTNGDCKSLSKRPQPINRDQEKKHRAQFQALLAFTKSTDSALIDTDHCSVSEGIPKLSAIQGCEELNHVRLFDYTKALLLTHLQVVKNINQDGNKLMDSKKILNYLSTKDHDTLWSENLHRSMTDSSLLENGMKPPMITRTSVALRFVLRVGEKLLQLEKDLQMKVFRKWFSSEISKHIALLIQEVFSLWRKLRDSGASDDYNHCDALEYAACLFEFSMSLELESSGETSAIPGIESKSLFTTNIHGHKTSFHRTLNTAYDYLELLPTKSGREFKQALSEIVQLYEKICRSEWTEDNVLRIPWKRIEEACPAYLGMLASRSIFWSTCVQSVLQVALKEDQVVMAAEPLAFLYSLVCDPEIFRRLLQSEEKCRLMMGELVLRFLERVARDPVTFWIDSSAIQESDPNVRSPWTWKLIAKLMSSSLFQRELISSEAEVKNRYLDCLDSIIMKTAKVSHGSLKQDTLAALANDGAFPKWKSDISLLFSTGSSDSKKLGAFSMECGAAKQRALALSIILIGALGKSMENGEWNSSHMNSISTLISSKFQSGRKLLRLWEDVIYIRGSIDNPGKLSKEENAGELTITPEDRNHFSMVLEYIRKQAANLQKKEAVVDENQKRKGLTNEEIPVLSANDFSQVQTISLPDVKSVPCLREAASNNQGYTDFDDDVQILSVVSKELRRSAHEVLARYDPESDIIARWTKLARGNYYVEGARELLDVEDKEMGHKCSCVAGRPRDNGEDRNRRLGCSNDLCENRHMKMECVPGKCGSGGYCQNQRFQKMEYSKFRVTKVNGKGNGLIADSNIPVGTFIGEYQGEVISNELFQKRKKVYEGEKHFYFMTLTSKLVIDASRKSQGTRFVNHSCNPNCETQKWNASGEPRVGIFAMRDIVKGDEITFDYGARSLASDSVPCLCGAENCRGFLVVRKDEVQKVDEELDQKSKSRNIEVSEEDSKLLVKSDDTAKIDAKKKIEEARKDLKSAEQLERKISSTAKSMESFSEDKLLPEQRQRLQEWEREISQHSLKTTGSSVLSVGDIRIPRKSIFPGMGKDRQPFKYSNPIGAANGITSNYDNQAKSTFGSKANIGQNTGFKNLASRANHRQQFSSFERSIHRAASQKPMFKNQRLTKREGQLNEAISDKPAKGRSLWLTTAFMPTTTKYVKRPKIAPRKSRRKRDNDEVDSMDGYSTASSAEPFIDDEPLSPIQMPGEEGACSDDEFIEAPPIEDSYDQPCPESNTNIAPQGTHHGKERLPSHGQQKKYINNRSAENHPVPNNVSRLYMEQRLPPMSRNDPYGYRPGPNMRFPHVSGDHHRQGLHRPTHGGMNKFEDRRGHVRNDNRQMHTRGNGTTEGFRAGDRKDERQATGNHGPSHPRRDGYPHDGNRFAPRERRGRLSDHNQVSGYDAHGNSHISRIWLTSPGQWKVPHLRAPGHEKEARNADQTNRSSFRDSQKLMNGFQEVNGKIIRTQGSPIANHKEDSHRIQPRHEKIATDNPDQIHNPPSIARSSSHLHPPQNAKEINVRNRTNSNQKEDDKPIQPTLPVPDSRGKHPETQQSLANKQKDGVKTRTEEKSDASKEKQEICKEKDTKISSERQESVQPCISKDVRKQHDANGVDKQVRTAAATEEIVKPKSQAVTVIATSQNQEKAKEAMSNDHSQIRGLPSVGKKGTEETRTELPLLTKKDKVANKNEKTRTDITPEKSQVIKPQRGISEDGEHGNMSGTKKKKNNNMSSGQAKLGMNRQDKMNTPPASAGRRNSFGSGRKMKGKGRNSGTMSGPRNDSLGTDQAKGGSQRGFGILSRLGARPGTEEEGQGGRRSSMQYEQNRRRNNSQDGRRKRTHSDGFRPGHMDRRKNGRPHQHANQHRRQ